MNHDQVKELIQKILKAALFLTKLTPNPMDDVVVGFLQTMAANDELMEILLSLFDKLKEVQDRRTAGVVMDLDIAQIVKDHLKG